MAACEVCGDSGASVELHKYKDGARFLCFPCRARRDHEKHVEYFARRKGFYPYYAAKVKKERGNQCELCGATENLEIHHIKRLIDGGDHGRENLQVLCAHCHHSVIHGGDRWRDRK